MLSKPNMIFDTALSLNFRKYWILFSSNNFYTLSATPIIVTIDSIHHMVRLGLHIDIKRFQYVCVGGSKLLPLLDCNGS